MKRIGIVRRVFLLAFFLGIGALVSMALSAHVAAHGLAQTAPTATPVTVATPITTKTATSSLTGRIGGKTCRHGIGMGQSVCTSTGMGGVPSTGGGGTAGRNVVPAGLPRTGGGGPGSSSYFLPLALAALLLAAGLALLGLGRNPLFRR